MDYHYLKIDGLNVISPRAMADAAAAQGFPADFWGLANSVHVPIGFDPGTAYLLVPRSTMLALDADGLHTLSWSYSRGSAPKVTEWHRWTICDARIQGIDGDSQASYWLTLRDSRQILQRAKVVNKSYNVTVPSPCGTYVSGRRYLSGTLNGSSPWSWQEMLAEVWGNLPAAAGSVPALPWTPDHYPDTWRFHGIQAWEAVRMILDACQCTIKPANNGLSYEIVYFGTAQDASVFSLLANRLMRDEKPKDPCSCVLPAKVVVTFPTRPVDYCEGDLQAYQEQAPVYAAASASTGLDCADSAQELAIRYDLVGEIDCDGSLINKTELDSSAATIAAMAAARLGVCKNLYRVHSGICHEVTLGSSIHELRYRDYGDDEGCVTESIGHIRWGLPAEAWTRPARECRCEPAKPLIVRATECILPGDGGSVQPQQWNTETDCWEDMDVDPIEIIDPMGWLLAVPGDCFKVDPPSSTYCDSGANAVYMPSFPFGMTQLVRIPEKIECGDCGEVEIIRKATSAGSQGESEHCDTEATECKFQACNMSYRPLSCDAPEYAIAHIFPGQCCLPEVSPSEKRCIAYLMPYPRPLIGIGTVPTGSKMCGNTPELQDVGFLDACSEYPGQAPTAYSNPMKLHACAESKVLLLWCTQCGSPSDQIADSCGWVAVQVEDAELPDWILDLRCGTDDNDPPTCTVEKEYKLQKRYGHFCECDNDDTDWDRTLITTNVITVIETLTSTTGEGTSSVLTSADCGEDCGLTFGKSSISTAELKKSTRNICVFCLGGETPSEESLGEFMSLGSAEVPAVIVGHEIDVITEITMKSEVTSDGGGDEFDCETAGEVNLELVGKTRRVCILCGGDGEGNFARGDDWVLPLKFAPVEAITEADFYCDPCIGLDVKTTQFYALCVGDESTATSVVCDCYECPPESA